MAGGAVIGLTVSRDRVKERCRVPDSADDGLIDRLIADIVSAVNAELRPDALENDSLTASLSLAATELACAEYLDVRSREPGAAGSASVLDVSIGEEPSTAAVLRSQAEARLAPYRRIAAEVGTRLRLALDASGGSA